MLLSLAYSLDKIIESDATNVYYPSRKDKASQSLMILHWKNPKNI